MVNTAGYPGSPPELVERRVNLLVATGGDASARAAKEATATIPVIFNMGSDPVKASLVESFNRPGGNVTGSVILTEAMEQKRFSMLVEIVPAVGLFGVIVNPNYPASVDQMRDLEAAAPKWSAPFCGESEQRYPGGGRVRRASA